MAIGTGRNAESCWQRELDEGENMSDITQEQPLASVIMPAYNAEKVVTLIWRRLGLYHGLVKHGNL